MEGTAFGSHTSCTAGIPKLASTEARGLSRFVTDTALLLFGATAPMLGSHARRLCQKGKLLLLGPDCLLQNKLKCLCITHWALLRARERSPALGPPARELQIYVLTLFPLKQTPPMERYRRRREVGEMHCRAGFAMICTTSSPSNWESESSTAVPRRPGKSCGVNGNLNHIRGGEITFIPNCRPARR